MHFSLGCAGSLLLCSGFLSLVVVSGGYFQLMDVCRLFTAVASLVTAHRLGVVAEGPYRVGLEAAVHMLSCFSTGGILPDRGLNSCPLALLVGRFLITGTPGKALLKN